MAETGQGSRGRGWLAFVRAMARDGLVLLAPIFLLAVVTVPRTTVFVPSGLVSGTFTLDDGTVVRARSPEEIQQVRRDYRGRIRKSILRRAGDQALGDVLASVPVARIILFGSVMFLGYAALVERRKLATWFRPRWRDAALGLAGGFLLAWGIGAAEAVATSLGLFRGEDPYAGIAGRWWFPLLACGIAPVGEELYFRGRLQDLARDTIGGRWAWLVPAAPFVLLHPLPPGRALVAAVLYLVLAVTLGWARERTGRLVAPVLLHAAYNTTYLFLVAAALGLE